MSKKKLKVVDFDSKKKELKVKEDEEWHKEMKETCDRLLKAIKEDRIEDLVIHWDETAEDEDDHDTSNVTVWFNRTANADRLLGFVSRLNHRIFLMTEGIFMSRSEEDE